MHIYPLALEHTNNNRWRSFLVQTFQQNAFTAWLLSTLEIVNTREELVSFLTLFLRNNQ